MEALTLIGASSFFNDAEFERVFGGTITGLNRVLRSSYAVEKDGLRGPIGKMIAKVRCHEDLSGMRKYELGWPTSERCLIQNFFGHKQQGEETVL